MKYDVVTFGSATVDIFTQPEKERSVKLCVGDHCEELIAYTSGSKILIREPVFEIGGGGTNTAACFTNLGCKVAYCGGVGKDQEGERVLGWLENNNIDFVGVRTEETTNTSIILDSHLLHDRTILAYKGASDAVSDEDINPPQATWYYFSSLLGQSYQMMLSRMRMARNQGIAVAFNPSNYQAQQGLDHLREAITLSQVLVLNKEEAAMLVGNGTREELCRRLRGSGAEIVLVTDGGDGATLLYANTLYSARPDENNTVTETTGAGDCFASSFIAGLIMGFEPAKALRLAFINVESLVGQVGPKKGLLTREEALRRLENDSREIIEENI